MPCRVCLLNVIHCRADPNTFPQPRHSLSTFPHYTVALHLPTFTWYTVSEQLWSVKVEKSPFRWQSALTSRKERSPSTAPVLSELAQSEGEVITLSSRFFSECYLNKFRPSSTLSFIFARFTDNLVATVECKAPNCSLQNLMMRVFFFFCYRRHTGLDFCFNVTSKIFQ